MSSKSSSSDSSSDSEESIIRTKNKNRKKEERHKQRKRSSSPESKDRRKNYNSKTTGSQQAQKKSKFTLQPDSKLSQTHPQTPKTTDTIERIPPHLQKNYKFAMKVYITNLPQNFNKDDLALFLYRTLDKANGLLQPGNPITNSTHYADKKYVFYTFRSIEEATQCFMLDGVIYRGKSLKFKRPTEYADLTKDKRIQGSRILPKMDFSHVKISKVSNVVENGFNKLFVGNLPLEWQEEQILDLLCNFGELKSFALTTDKQTGVSKGFCFCEYKNDQETDDCLKKLNKISLSGKPIYVKRAILMSQSQLTTGIITNATQLLSNYNQQVAYNPNLIAQSVSKPIGSTSIAVTPTVIAPTQIRSSGFQTDLESYYATFDINGFFKNLKISCVLQFRNVIPLYADHEAIKKDLCSQLERIGKIVKIVHKAQSVWVEYEKVEYSQIAYLLLLNHKYDGKNIDVLFYDPISFADGIYA